MLMGMFILGVGGMTRPMGMGRIFPHVGRNMLVTGLRINRMALVSRRGQMRQSTWASIRTVRKREKESSCGQMTVLIRVNFTRTISTVLEGTSGRMARFMKGSGRITKWKAMVHLPGQMEGSMSGTISRTGSKALGSLPSKMAGSTKASGSTGSNMGEASSERRT